MSLENKIKESIKFIGLTTASCGMVYGLQQALGTVDNTLNYNNLVYPSITGVGLTIAYYLGK